LFQLKVGANHEDVIKTTINPNNKPKDCVTPVTASALYFLVKLPPKKSAVPHKSDESRASIVAIN
jgi:hypothetical protein